VFQPYRYRRRIALVVALLLALAPAAADAHVRWFVEEERYPPEWGLLLSWRPLLVLATAAALLGGLLLLRRAVGTPHFPNPPFLSYMEPSATALLAVHTGIALVFFASEVELLVPSLELDRNLLGWLLVTLQIVTAFSLITGLIDRGGALLLAGVWLLGFAAFSPWAMIDQVLFAGIAVALFVLGRTIPPPSVAARLLPLGNYERLAVTALRVLAGFSFMWVAFTEKLLAPDAAAAFLQVHPEFNVPRELLGWEWWTDARFAVAAGVVEASAGILLMTGVLTRVVILTLLVPFNLTVAFLPPIELLGHLPIFGIMYVLLLYGSGAQPHAKEQLLEPALRGAVQERERRLAGALEMRSPGTEPGDAGVVPGCD
jgi:hypothetical protein